MADPKLGQEQARRLFPVLGTCERCGLTPARDRHHKDGDTFNNRRENLAFLCRRCHQIEDGRHARLRPFTPVERAAGTIAAAAAMRARTHCVHGHPFDQDNTYTDANGWRYCRTCRREREAARRRR